MPAPESCFSIERGKADNPVTWKGAAVKLTSSAQLMFAFSAEDVSGYTVRIADSAKRIIAEIPADDFVPYHGGYYVCSPDIPFDQWGDAVYVNVLRGIKLVSPTLQYSVNSYFARSAGRYAALNALMTAAYGFAAAPGADASLSLN